MPARGLAGILESLPPELMTQAQRRGIGHGDYPALMDDLRARRQGAWSRRGYDYLGHGQSGGVVRGNPDENTVVKTWHGDGGAYQRYLDLIMRGGNEHFPLAGQVEDLGYGGRASILERLQPLSPSNRDLARQAEAYVKARRQGKAVDPRDMPQSLVTALDRLIEEQSRGGVRFDLHEGNFMERPDGTLVITDPFKPRWSW